MRRASVIIESYSKCAVTSILLFSVFFAVSACGRKGPPTLKAYEKPQAPGGLSAVRRENRITLTWSYPGNLRESLNGFVVLRAEGGGFERVGFASHDENSFIDEAFNTDVKYRYKVVAQSLKGILSNDSNVIALIPRRVPASPQDMHFSVKGGSVELSWKSSGEGSCYNIYRTADKGEYKDTPLNKEPVCTTFFRDTATSPDRTVYFTVRALNMSGILDEGPASEEVEVNPSHFVPLAPTDLRVVRSTDKIHLIWKESPEPWVKGYRVYRRKDKEQGFTFLGETIIPAFTDTEKVKGKVWYIIRAIGSQSESEPLTGVAK